MKSPGGRNFFHWSSSSDLVAVFASLILMLFFNYLSRTTFYGSLIFPFIRGYIVWVGLGVAFPVYWTLVRKGGGLESLGVTMKGGLQSLILNLLSSAFMIGFVSLWFGLDVRIWPVLALGLTLMPLVLFVYGWLQLRVEAALGSIPGIVLSGICFSLMFWGGAWYNFSLFFIFALVGIFLACIFRISKNLLSLWPFLTASAWLLISEIMGIRIGWLSLRAPVLCLVLAFISIFIFSRYQEKRPHPVIRWVLYGSAAAVLIFFGYYFVREIRIMAAVKAKTLCSCVFVADREPESVLKEELRQAGRYIGYHIDRDERSVTASFLPVVTREAVFLEGLGCTLVVDFPEEAIRARARDYRSGQSAALEPPSWPGGEKPLPSRISSKLDLEKIRSAVTRAFTESNPRRPRKRTRAVIILYEGHLLAERYAPGFSEDTPQKGFSMTKSVMNALIGILIGQGKLSLESKALIPEWRQPDDPRSAITLDHVLRMSSGIKWEEGGVDPFADVWTMMFAHGDGAGYAARKPLESEPGTRWEYCSGSSRILALIVRNALGGRNNGYLNFPKQALFDRIGMHSAVLETDASGTFEGDCFMYATARDWARFGLLYLRDGLWGGERILPEGWVDYTRTPSPTALLGQYGAQFWLNAGAPGDATRRWMPMIPADMYSAVGHEGQYFTIIPSRKLVVVRLGSTSFHWKNWDHESFVAEILDGIRK